MRTLIHNTRAISPGIDRTDQSVLIEDGLITAAQQMSLDADNVIDAEGRMLLPGFIDIHSHGAAGHNISSSIESLENIARNKLREGVTTWLPTTLTLPREELRAIAEAVAAFREDSPPLNCPGLHLEGPFINPARIGAQNPESVRLPDLAELEELHAICPIVILSLAPEMPGALELIKRARDLGIICSAAHTSATAGEIRKAIPAGLRHLTHFGNAMSPLHQREIGAIGEGLINDALMLELIADGIHLAPEMLQLIFKLVPIERLMLITDSMAASWMSDGEFQLGGQLVHVQDGIARLAETGDLAGSTLRFNEGLKNLAAATGLPLSELVRTTSNNQARSLGFGNHGRIESGHHADLVLLNQDVSVADVFVGGKPCQTRTPLDS